MAYEQIFRPDLNLVYTRFGPSLDLATAHRCAVDTFRNPRYVAGMRELLDLRELTDPDPNFDFSTINQIWETQATWILALRRRAQVVMVASSDLVFGLCRIYASLATEDGVKVTTCREWATACELLGLEPGTEFDALAAEG